MHAGREAVVERSRTDEFSVDLNLREVRSRIDEDRDRAALRGRRGFFTDEGRRQHEEKESREEKFAHGSFSFRRLIRRSRRATGSA